jgi:hypothetical protein
MKILVIGHKGHGKDEVAKTIQRLYGLRYASSSWFAMEHFLWPILQDKIGYTSMEECFHDRVNHRILWRDLIRAYNQLDLARLARELLEEHDQYVGMRCHFEYGATEDLFGPIIWVDASRRRPAYDESMTIEYDAKRMIWLDNNGPKILLEAKIMQAIGSYF